VRFAEKDAFVMLFGEVYLLWNSKMFSDEVVYYMFGYYALRCGKSDAFWRDLKKESTSYGHFWNFFDRLQGVENGYKPNPREFTLAMA
jgi:hypothetical protein